MATAKSRRKPRFKKHSLKRRLTYLLAATTAIALIGILAYSTLGPRNPPFVDYTPAVAIVDHLSIQWPDQNFLQTIQTILNETSLKVEYYPNEDITVDFYRKLPSHNYKLIIFRVHSTAECSAEGQPPYVVFFTSETYSTTKHVSEQLDMRLVYVNFPENEPPGYFGITPLFIEASMEGRLNDTIIISMGCDGLKENTMAEAFVEKGAKAYISWNGSVSASHTDEATTFLLRHLITENQTIKNAVKETMNEVGPDPVDKSILMFYPDKAGTSFLLVNATIAAPTVRAARKNNNEISRALPHHK